MGIDFAVVTCLYLVIGITLTFGLASSLRNRRPNARLALGFLLLALAACGGDSDGGSPTEPPAPVALEGTWTGTITVTNPSPTSTCSVTVTLDKDPQDPTFFTGNWSASCPNGQGGNLALVNLIPGNFVVLIGVGSSGVFNGCSWSILAPREGRRLNGDWQTPQNCQTGPAQSGRIELNKQN